VVVIDLTRFEAFLFDELLARHAERTGTPFVPFDADADYHRYVDGRPRHAGIVSFLAARGLDVPLGSPEDDAGRETVHGLGRRKTEYFLELLEREGVQVFESAVRLVREARARGVRTAVVSSSRNCAAVLRAARLTDLFDARVDGVELQRLGLAGKPAPDMFLEAARRLGAPPARSVVFEDAVVGVEAGRAGGFGLVIGVGSPDRAAELLAHGAHAVVADVGEVQLVGREAAAQVRR
jgi:HAD superfamily hydrolase (TIGR01509 family)